MSLAESLGSPMAYRGTRHCSFKAWLETLGPTEVTAVRAALVRTTGDPLYWTTPQLQAELSAAGWTGSESVIYKHRLAGACRQCR